ncbi:MAG TPA: class I SAM-dependent methyltransferase [Gemmataceae bacterium]|jgi:SAM-dependent methyltransferase
MTHTAGEPPDVAASEQAYFDRYVTDHGDFNPFAARGWETLARRFREMADPRPDARLLDIGCGTGHSHAIYAGAVGSYLGVDLSPAAVEMARTAFPHDEWQVADACDLPFMDESFDVVAFSSVLHHIPDFPRAVREARRVLRPDGVAFAFDPNLLHPAMALFRHPASPGYIPEGVSPNERPLLPTTLARAFRRAGFSRLRQRGQSDIPYRKVAPKRLNAALSAYNVADWVWERVGLGLVFGTFVLTCGRKRAR